jgi:hypothetical protein
MADGGTSLVTDNEQLEPFINTQHQKTSKKFSLKVKAIFAVIVLLSVAIMVVAIINEKPIDE